jgi:hypothetical protein
MQRKAPVQVVAVNGRDATIVPNAAVVSFRKRSSDASAALGSGVCCAFALESPFQRGGITIAQGLTIEPTAPNKKQKNKDTKL